MAIVDTSAPLPDLKLQSLSTFTVTLDDAAAVITELVVHGDQQAGEDIETLTLSQIYLTPVAGEVIRPDPIDGRGD